ncbi:hypothetical protein C5167_007963 [Papaver somniferum]|uniref:RNA helicase n=1 Tax=Papaver somniferum TaxID=3469 RepID=A0A4Y7JWC1_PAPSO|nr:hypothetical protein C5167_007963 [Papaver somniferum]
MEVTSFHHDSISVGFGMHISGFKDFLLKPELLIEIDDSGFEHPSEGNHFLLTEVLCYNLPFGSQSVQHAILGTDVISQEKSGMGKYVVFVLSTLHQIETVAGQVAALILCHTRESAYQVCVHTELPYHKPSFLLLPTSKLENECPHVIVGIPGRILAFAREKDLALKIVRNFILDECDKMLESLDMRKDVQKIFKMTPHDKQVKMFSATLSKEIHHVCKKFMQDTMEICVDNEVNLTLHGLVLTRYKGFKEGHKRILVETDLVGRGIDIERVNIVINYDMPDSADTYFHRSRSIGTKGLEVTVVSSASDSDVLNQVDSLLGARGGGSEHEATRRMRNEFMEAWDGLRPKYTQ